LATDDSKPGGLATGNLFADLPTDTLAEECFEALLARPGVRLERIVSTGQATPEGDWYDQESDEWVVLLRGTADLLIEGEASARMLEPGDWVYLPARCRHRVTRTDAHEPTIWLALHLEAALSKG
jgi:cupin 2 domain-containing protein